MLSYLLTYRKTTQQRHGPINDPKQVTSGRSVKDDTAITVADNVNYVTCDNFKKAKTTSGLNGPSVFVPASDTNDVDDVNYASITASGDSKPTELPPSKIGLVNDTELVDNLNYAGLGEEVTTTGDYELAGPFIN